MFSLEREDKGGVCVCVCVCVCLFPNRGRSSKMHFRYKKLLVRCGRKLLGRGRPDQSQLKSKHRHGALFLFKEEPTRGFFRFDRENHDIAANEMGTVCCTLQTFFSSTCGCSQLVKKPSSIWDNGESHDVLYQFLFTSLLDRAETHSSFFFLGYMIFLLVLFFFFTC